MSLPPELSPGSSEPSNPADVERVLAGAPELAFLEALEPCIPALPKSAEGTRQQQLDALADADYRMTVSGVLAGVEAACEDQGNAGLQFLARTMRHFLDVQPVPSSTHPLMVALFLRAVARRDGGADSVRAIASVMDGWE